ncbi:MAG: endonuclease [Pseudobdellovibrio sp.]
MKNAVMFLVLSLAYSLAFSLQPPQQSNYYGKDFYNTVVTHAKDVELKTALKLILKSGHMKTVVGDEMTDTCLGKKDCYTQNVLGYDGARKFLFGNFYLVKSADSVFGIKEKYCDRIYQGADFQKGNGPGVGIVPDAAVINTEHTWPQSKFTGKYNTEMQKSDLHHLFPTDSKMNSLRGNFTFGEVVGTPRPAKCEASRFGQASNSKANVFEPPADHKGHVARALFYFSIRYDLPISQPEEEILKKWDQEHPIDEEEILRNEAIYKVQGNRNPFIDYPELVKNISDF